MSEMAVHSGQVWMRFGEGSARAECNTCDWKGPKRTIAGELAYEDLEKHIEEMKSSEEAGNNASTV